MFLTLVLLANFYFGAAFSSYNPNPSTRIPNDIIRELEDTIALINSYQKSSKDSIKKLGKILDEQNAIKAGNE